MRELNPHASGVRSQHTRSRCEPSFLHMPFKEAVAALERELIRRALAETNGNRTEAARRLGINRRLLYSKLEEHGLEK